MIIWNYENIFSAVGHVWGITAIILLITAVILIRSNPDRFEGCHKWMMFTMVVGGWGFVLLYLAGTFLRSVPLNVPKSLALWLAIHGIIALVTLLGSTLVLLTRKIGEAEDVNGTGFRVRFNARHKLYGWIFVLMWLFTHVGGVVNLYIIG